jgi:glucose/arabinose dehydrogenase
MGVDPATVKSAAPATPAAGSPLPVAAPSAPAAPPVAPWTPGTRLEGSWGVRVVSIVADAQPPRAILGLPDGKEVVVEPGAFIDSEKLVVTAIGREAVQVAHVVPVGDRVRIEDRTLTPLYAPAPRTPAP